MPQRPKPLEYRPRPIAAGRYALFTALAITLALEVTLTSIAVKRGALLGIFLLMAVAVAIVGAIIGWFFSNRPGAVVAGCLVIVVAPMVLILSRTDYGPPRSLDALEEVAIYWTFPFMAVFLLPALIGGMSVALLRARFRSARERRSRPH